MISTLDNPNCVCVCVYLRLSVSVSLINTFLHLGSLCTLAIGTYEYYGLIVVIRNTDSLSRDAIKDGLIGPGTLLSLNPPLICLQKTLDIFLSNINFSTHEIEAACAWTNDGHISRPILVYASEVNN